MQTRNVRISQLLTVLGWGFVLYAAQMMIISLFIFFKDHNWMPVPVSALTGTPPASTDNVHAVLRRISNCPLDLLIMTAGVFLLSAARWSAAKVTKYHGS
jgi:hypothetical protein